MHVGVESSRLVPEGIPDLLMARPASHPEYRSRFVQGHAESQR
jgi:hypothetical protein